MYIYVCVCVCKINKQMFNVQIKSVRKHDIIVLGYFVIHLEYTRIREQRRYRNI